MRVSEDHKLNKSLGRKAMKTAYTEGDTRINVKMPPPARAVCWTDLEQFPMQVR